MKTALPKEAYNKNAHIYKILANPKRLEILNLLKVNNEMSCEEMIKITKMPKANLSQHRHNGVVQTRREGLNIFYKMIDNRIVSPCKILHELRHKHLIR